MSEPTPQDFARARDIIQSCPCSGRRSIEVAGPFDCDDCDGTGVRGEHKGIHGRIAIALVEQRERDAEIAMLTHVPEDTPIGDVPGFLSACHQIGAAISQGTNAPTPKLRSLLCAGPQGHYWLHKPLLNGGSRERCDYCGIPKPTPGGTDA